VIDKIDGLGGVRVAAPVRRPVKTGGSGGTSFARHLDESGETTASSSLSSANAVSSILGVQEVDDATAHASRGKARAFDILDRLDDLRMQLLAGGISREKLMQLSRTVSARRAQVTDPRLAALLDDIDLRAQVELAKYAPP
jgi:hypothetical protein